MPEVRDEPEVSTVTIPVTGMSCAACQAFVQKTLEQQAGVESATVNLLLQNATVRYAASGTSPNALVEAIRETGVLKEFPRRTEADLYIWVAYHRERLHELYGVTPDYSEVATRLAQQFSERPLVRLGKTVRRVVSAAARAARATPEPPNLAEREAATDMLATRPFTRPDNPDGDQ